MEQGGLGKVGQTVFQKQNYGLRIGLRSRGLGMNSGHGEVWIRVLERCYMECNNELVFSRGTMSLTV